jgi:chromosome segregation ATPase
LAELKAEKELLQSKIEELEEFKKLISQSENGDVIINLTNLTSNQKEQIKQLQSKINIQTQTLATVKEERDELQRKIAEKDDAADKLQNDKIELLQRLIEKDSIINALEDRIKQLDEAFTACSETKRAAPREKKARRKKMKKEQDPVLFDE